MSNTLRSKVIRLAHQNPSLRPHLLPLLQEVRTAADHFAALVQPKGYGDAVYEGNAMAVPLWWGVTKTLSPETVAEHMYPLFHDAKGGVAYVLDQKGVFAAAGLAEVEKKLQYNIEVEYQMRVAEIEEHVAETGDPDYLPPLARARKRADAASKIRVSITPITSPKSGKAGLKVVFSPTVEQIEAIR